jgi:hypothetical protein
MPDKRQYRPRSPPKMKPSAAQGAARHHVEPHHRAVPEVGMSSVVSI